MMADETRSGGCLCGAVRYSVAWPPLMIGTCQCGHCQKSSGSALTVIAMVSSDALKLEGELSTYEDKGDSGNPLFRRFCGKCGSPVVSDMGKDEAGQVRIIRIGSLDDTSGAEPTVHYWTSSGQNWLVLPEAGQRLERQ